MPNLQTRVSRAKPAGKRLPPLRSSSRVAWPLFSDSGAAISTRDWCQIALNRRRGGNGAHSPEMARLALGVY